jgi:hypothetical protein
MEINHSNKVLKIKQMSNLFQTIIKFFKWSFLIKRKINIMIASLLRDLSLKLNKSNKLNNLS